jgi:hypothetical protein
MPRWNLVRPRVAQEVGSSSVSSGSARRRTGGTGAGAVKSGQWVANSEQGAMRTGFVGGR